MPWMSQGMFAKEACKSLVRRQGSPGWRQENPGVKAKGPTVLSIRYILRVAKGCRVESGYCRIRLSYLEADGPLTNSNVCLEI